MPQSVSKKPTAMFGKELIENALKLGFIAVGFSRPNIPLHFERFVKWINEVEMGDISYLKRHLDLRKEPERLLNGLKAIISLAYPYPANKPTTPDGYSAARYTTPQEKDYHIRLRGFGKQLCLFIKEHFPESRCRVCVDSAPILERSFAAESGIGFIGKNNMLIVPGYGSYCFLVEILTTATFSIPSPKPIENKCSSCTKCIDSCPSGALKEPFFLDASKCLSYLTIEFKGNIDKQSAEKMGNVFFGCDACQEACPFNKNGSPVVSLPSTDDILSMDEVDFTSAMGKTAFERAGLKKLKQNISLIRQ